MTREPDPTTVIVECDLTEPPEKVWKALTVPELLARWLRPDDIDVDCDVLEAQPIRRLRLSWRDREEGVESIVTFDLTRTRTGGTHLRLVHEGFAVIDRGASPPTQLLMAA